MFDFLKLPRELRDQIYEELLVRNYPVPIKRNYEDTTGYYPSTYFSPTWYDDTKRYFPGVGACYKTCAVCYGPKKPSRTSERLYHLFRIADDEPIDLNIFLANRQVYDESRTVFYKENLFDFTKDVKDEAKPVHTALCFLKDRPEESLKYIRNIAVHIGTVTPCPVWVPDEAWHDLCVCLSHCMKLSYLHVVINGHGPDVRETHWKTHDNTGYPYGEERDQYAWVKELLEISGLDRLEIIQLTTRPVDEAIAFVKMLRTKMIKEDATRGTEEIEIYHPFAMNDVPNAALPDRWEPTYIVAGELEATAAVDSPAGQLDLDRKAQRRPKIFERRWPTACPMQMMFVLERNETFLRL